VANYLSAINGNTVGAVKNSGDRGSPGPAGEISSSNFSYGDALSIAGTASNILGAGGGFLTGSRPIPFHSEYTSGAANWEKPYAMGSDVIFYLMRADGGAPASSETPASAGTGVLPSPQGGGLQSFDGKPTRIGGGVQAAILSASIQSGPSLPDDMQSALNQVGVGFAMNKLTNVPKSPGTAGPLTGLTRGLTTEPGTFSQTASLFSSTRESVVNATQAVRSLESNAVARSIPASERFFTRTLFKSFNPGDTVSLLRTPDEIAESISRAPINELCSKLAVACRGVTTTTDFVEGLNFGDFGFSTPSSMAEADRIGPQGKLHQRRS